MPTILFRQVVTRWSDRVKVTALKKVNWDNSLVDEIADTYEELSSFIEGHTHPDESIGSPPGPEQLEDLANRVRSIIQRAKPQRQ